MAYFENTSLFQHLTKEEIEILQTVATLVTLAPNTLFVREGEISHVIYFNLQKRASVIVSGSQQVSYVLTLKKGQIVGELSALTNRPHAYNMTARDEIQLVSLNLQTLPQDLHAKILHFLVDDLSKTLLYSKLEDPEVSSSPSTILVMFGWKWKDIIYEIPFLAEHGYDAIKIYPPQEFVLRTGNPWWEVYQPVTYHLSSFYGTEDDFKSMIHLCHSFNIKIYADLVMNHMAHYSEQEQQHMGTNGHEFSQYHYGPLNADNDFFERKDFYQYAEQSEPQVGDPEYKKLERSWHLEHHQLLHLPKLNLKETHVIEVLRKYVKMLLSYGIDGFRIDATKHLNITYAKKVLDHLHTQDGLKPFLYLEYFTGMPEGIDIHSYMSKYFDLGHVTCFDYGDFLSNAILKRGPNQLQSLVEFSFGSSWLQFPENRTVVVLDNHDTERYLPHRLNYKFQDKNAYTLAYIFMLSWPFGIPKIMTGPRFEGHDDGFPQAPIWQNGRNTCFDPGSPWVGQHRWNAIANMVFFRKKTAHATGITHIWLNGDQVAFARTMQEPHEYVASIGFIVINNTGEVLKRRFDTGLPDGKYADLIRGKISLGKWESSYHVEVSHYGYAEIEVPPYDAVALLN